jgi:glucose-1-phosphate cytidylyltransferase
MNVIILAGGLGTRLTEYTKTIPKPMVKVAGYPILLHIMNHYIKFGFKNFYIATGYKGYVIKKFFRKYKKNGELFDYKIFNKKKCRIALVDTGLKTFTGGRLKRLENYINDNENFFFTYGDGISNVNIKKLLNYHNKSKKIITVTAVHPPARFGELKLKKNKVVSFKEKPQTNQGWINGGFFVAQKKFFKFIKNDEDILEKKPLEKAFKSNQLNAFKHRGFWKCMDTIRDKQVIDQILKSKKI